MNGKAPVQAFETSEYRDRLDKVLTAMSNATMDALIVISPANQCYLLGYDSYSGFEPQAVLVTLNDDPYFILRKMDADAATEAGCWLPQDRVVGYTESYVSSTGEQNAWEFIARFVKAKVSSSARIGVEVSELSAVGYRRLVTALGGQEPLDASGLVTSCKLVKSERELLYMTESALMADRAMLAGIDRISVGARHCEAAAAIISTVCTGTEGIPGGPQPYLPVIRGGKLYIAPHQTFVDTIFAADNQYYLECSASRHRYVAPVARTVHLGPATIRGKNQHECAMAGFHAAVDALRPGATCADVARAFQAAARPHGLNIEARIGYSVGIDWVDGPSLGTNNDTEILANMTFHLNILYEPGENYQFSETVRVTEVGAELMSKVPRILFERPT
ncbi:Xaa-Pro peptidase family protein [Mesorhizobium sp. C386A]|uniref:M24 family metallopeptidase n=1 Tax=unclassified Mesorhizobium TaxID=325217 RepID=UPI0003CF0620|nr:Xaa-Pro peptidase family protein [Mesorhizobium sp. LNJC386A00]ESY28260.1 hypothetical protein X748_29800 [Mesorhizobium sp. LNJC386A00]